MPSLVFFLVLYLAQTDVYTIEGTCKREMF